MTTLQSALFTSADAGVFQRLEDCANGYPNEVVSHFTTGQVGEHITLVQIALASIAGREAPLDIPAFMINGAYDADFAAAVAGYKTARNILNYANAIDDIVGKKTITSLDQELGDGVPPDPPPEPLPDPQPAPPPAPPQPQTDCVVEANCPVSTTFTLQLLGGLTGGEVLEMGLFLFDVHDTANNLSARYIGKVVGLGAESPIPASISVLGQPTAFTTGSPCKVTRFFAFAISSFTAPPPYPLSASPVTLSYIGEDGPGQTVPFLLDTGPLNLPGASIHAGTLDLQTGCDGARGARRGA
jgi:hypothetical protein